MFSTHNGKTFSTGVENPDFGLFSGALGLFSGAVERSPRCLILAEVRGKFSERKPCFDNSR